MMIVSFWPVADYVCEFEVVLSDHDDLQGG